MYHIGVWLYQEMMDRCAMPINLDQCAIKSLALIQNASQLIGIEKHWYHGLKFDRPLIHIDRHCTLIHHALLYVEVHYSKILNKEN